MLDANPALQQSLARLQRARIEELFASDPDRSERFSLTAAGIHLDFAKHRLDRPALDALIAHAEAQQLPNAFAALLAGAKVNPTEARPALHTLLRGTAQHSQPERWQAVRETLERLEVVVSAIHRGDFRGYSGEKLTDVVNIGIGGSDLGPRMVCEAIQQADDPMRAHFVANVDPWDLEQVLTGLDPASTLFIVCSKSFTTEETLSNAQRVRQWLLSNGLQPEHLRHHVLAVTTNITAAVEFGIDEAQCYPIWDWVGGRYSLWSAIGLVIALQSGWNSFQRLLEGAAVMDSHTADTAPCDNLPLTMALLEWWHCQLQGCANHLVLPYAQRLAQLPALLQQLTMESNGKRVDLNGQPLELPSAPMLWGSAGTIGQHSYFQLLHQGNRVFTADIVLPLTNGDVDSDAHRRLAANALAQSRALLTGRSPEQALELANARGMDPEQAAHLELPGNHSHSLIWFDAASPERIGALLAAYEHKTFFLGRLLDINPFDQWGVELGKVIGRQVLAMLESGTDIDTVDPATGRLIEAWRAANAD